MESKRFLKMKKNWKSLIRKCLSLANVIKLLSEIKIKISVKIVKIFRASKIGSRSFGINCLIFLVLAILSKKDLKMRFFSLN